jgi:hypothetical protein
MNIKEALLNYKPYQQLADTIKERANVESVSSTESSSTEFLALSDLLDGEGSTIDVYDMVSDTTQQRYDQLFFEGYRIPGCDIDDIII